MNLLQQSNGPRLILYLALVSVIIGLAIPAVADVGVGPLSVADATDSHGVPISSYQLSIQDDVINPLVPILRVGWSVYQWWIAVMGALADWTLGMEWVIWITGPVNTAQEHLRTAILAPLGATELGQGGLIALLCVIAGAVAGWHILRGRSSGWTSALSSALYAALAVGVFAAPVVTLAGNDLEAAKPLRYAQHIAVELGLGIATGKTSGVPLEADPAPDGGVRGPQQPHAGESAELPDQVISQQLADTFIRPVHQMLNFGVLIDAAHPDCVDEYDEVLKQGRYGGDASEIRDAVGRCNPDLKDYAEGAGADWIPVMAIFNVPAMALTAVVLVFVVLMWFAVAMLTWSAFVMVFHALLAIIPGSTKSPLIMDCMHVAVSLVYVVLAQVLLALWLWMIRETMGANSVNIVFRFMGAGLLLLVLLLLLIVNWVALRVTGKKLTTRMLEGVRQNVRQSLGDRAWGWAARPAAATATGRSAVTGQGTTLQSPIRRVLDSNGVQTAGRTAAAVGRTGTAFASGGVSAVKGGVTAVKRGARMARAVDAAATTYRGLREGGRRVSSGNARADAAALRAHRTKNWLVGVLHQSTAERGKTAPVKVGRGQPETHPAPTRQRGARLKVAPPGRFATQRQLAQRAHTEPHRPTSGTQGRLLRPEKPAGQPTGTRRSTPTALPRTVTKTGKAQAPKTAKAALPKPALPKPAAPKPAAPKATVAKSAAPKPALPKAIASTPLPKTSKPKLTRSAVPRLKRTKTIRRRR